MPVTVSINNNYTEFIEDFAYIYLLNRKKSKKSFYLNLIFNKKKNSKRRNTISKNHKNCEKKLNIKLYLIWSSKDKQLRLSFIYMEGIYFDWLLK